MAQNAFTANVKPGGLNNATEIRVLLCYLMHSVPAPLSQAEIEQALLGEELVNYFELAAALGELCDLHLASLANGHYTLTEGGIEIAANLMTSVPLSVRESAVRAALAAQVFARKQAQHQVTITPQDSGYMIRCCIVELDSEVFSTSLFLPDMQMCNLVKQRFVEHGELFYSTMLTALTGNKELLHELLQRSVT